MSVGAIRHSSQSNPVLEALYKNVFRRNQLFGVYVVAGALVFGAGFNAAGDALWRGMNSGVMLIFLNYVFINNTF